MKHFATGWACNLNDLFVRFPYEKYKSLMKNYKSKQERLKLIKRVFREGVKVIMEDIIENNSTFKIQGIGYLGGEIHMEAVKGKDFYKARENGKFDRIDFLESMFTGYQMFLYIHGKSDNFLARKKYPIYLGKFFKDKIINNTNSGKQYC